MSAHLTEPALLPAAAGGIVIAIALPNLPARRWRVSGWAIGAVSGSARGARLGADALPEPDG